MDREARSAGGVEAASRGDLKLWAIEVRKLIERGRFDEARVVVHAMRGREIGGTNTVARTAARWLERYTVILDRFPASPPPGYVPDGLAEGGPDTVVVPRSGASGALLVFCTKRWEAFALHPVLAERPLHVVYLFDPRGLACGTGVESIGPTYRDTLDGLRALVCGLSTDRVYTLGASRGGYTAIRYGLDLGGAGVLAFSPVIDVVKGMMLGKTRGAALVARARRYDPDAAIDLMPLIQRCAGRTPIHIWYGKDVPTDCHHARYVEGAPGVSPRPLDDAPEHNSLLTVLTDGRMKEALDTLLETPSYPSSTGESDDRVDPGP